MIAPKVLLVDDEESFVDVVAKRLSLRGFDTLTALSGKAALELLDTVPNVEVVVLDLKMPGLDGIETLNLIKNVHPLVEVIILTGHATVPSSIEGMKLGAYDYLTKPAETEKLVSLIEAAASKKRHNEDTVVRIMSNYPKVRRKMAENEDPFIKRALGLENEESS